MKKLALTVLNLPERKFLSKVTTSYEPEPHHKAALEKRQDIRQGCKYGWLQCHGIGRLFRYCQYKVSEPVTFYSIPVEPVVVLHIQLKGEAYYHYAKQEVSKQSWPEEQCRLFWQGMEVLENHLGPDDHHQFDLFYRPDVFAKVAENPRIKRLTKQVRSSRHGNTDFYTVQLNDSIAEHFANLLEELQHGNPSVKRFHYLADTVLLACLGEDVQKLVWDGDVAEPEATDPLSARNERIMGDLGSLEGDALKLEFTNCLQANRERSAFLQNELELIESLNAKYGGLCGESINHFADVYFEFARFLAVQLRKRTWNPAQLKKLKKAIIAACETAFELKNPDPEELEFYYQWAPRPTGGALQVGMKELGNIVTANSANPGRSAQDFSTLVDTPEGRQLFVERIKEHADFQSLTQTSRQPEKDKPQLVVALYHELMQALADRIQITDDGTITRDDAVRLLDNAYDNNDVFGLLRVEIKCFAHEPGYLEKQQDENKIKWQVIALREELEQLEDEIRLLPKTPGYSNLELFRSLDESHRAFEEQAIEHAAVLKQGASDLRARHSRRLYANPTTKIILAAAQDILSVRGGKT